MPFVPAALVTTPVAGALGGIAWHTAVQGEVNRLRTFEPPIRKILTADLAANTAIAPASIAGLACDVVANDWYEFQFVLLWQSITTSGTGIRVTVNLGNATTLAAIARMTNGVADGVSAMWYGDITTSGDIVANSQAAALSTTYTCFIEGVCRASIAGNIAPALGSETAGQSIVVKAGSWGRCQRIG